MTTKDEILRLADNHIRESGYNGFSFYDISKSMGIKTASIHYHFSTKSDLGIAVVKMHIKRFETLKESLSEQNPEIKLDGFFQIYSNIQSENKICIVGSLATDFNTLEKSVQEELKLLSDKILNWVTEILTEGKAKKIFSFDIPARTKALMVIANMLAILQLSRLTKFDDFITIKNAITKELTSKK